MNTAKIYVQLGDGFEFILPMTLEEMNVTLKFMAKAIYDFTANEWKKYGITVYDSDCVQYQFRSGELETRRQNFDDVPVLTYDDLCSLCYMIQREGSSAYVMNKREYSIRIQAFVEKMKKLPTTINLGVDEEVKALMEESEAREEEAAPYVWKPPRTSGRTYVQLGDGFEFVMERPAETVNHMMMLSSASVYDIVDGKWCKYRSTIYKDAEGRLHSKFFADEENRPKNFESVPILTNDDLVKAGYMIDVGENSMARYRFDYIVYQRRRKAANLIFDDAATKERETGSSELKSIMKD